MTPRFTSFIGFILEWETEYNRDGSVKVERDEDDPGGTTKFGIDQRSHPAVDIENLTKEGAIALYWTHYWNGQAASGIVPVCESLPALLGEAHMNARVNTGKGRAAKLLDASHGSAASYIDEQDAFYRRLVDARPKSGKYLKGWLNRTRALRQKLGIKLSER